jgi:2-polyprenyl-6-methoxyphenol hydroxylase-like FAD-dependent oxidoreductase
MVGSEAIVVGAGPGGLTAAIALRQAGIEATVFERRAALGDGGSGLTLWPNAMDALDWLGLAGAVRAVSAPAHGIAIRSARGRVLDATGPEIMQRYFSGAGAALRRADLQDVLADALGREHVRVGARFEALEPRRDGLVARFADGTERRAALLVGADGMRSPVRQALVGDLRLRYSGYTVWRGVTPFALAEAGGTLSMGRGAQFGLFPMRAGRVYWFASLTVAEQGSDIGRDGLLDAFEGWHEPVGQVIAATDPETIVVTPIHDADPFPLRARGAVALVGDAAHPSTPGLGQGACQAIEDAVVLGRCLQSGNPVADALREYQRLRVHRTNAMTRQARRMGALGQWHSATACWLRDRLIEYLPKPIRIRQLRWMFTFNPGGPARPNGSPRF